MMSGRLLDTILKQTSLPLPTKRANTRRDWTPVPPIPTLGPKESIRPACDHCSRVNGVFNLGRQWYESNLGKEPAFMPLPQALRTASSPTPAGNQIPGTNGIPQHKFGQSSCKHLNPIIHCRESWLIYTVAVASHEVGTVQLLF